MLNDQYPKTSKITDEEMNMVNQNNYPMSLPYTDISWMDYLDNEYFPPNKQLSISANNIDKLITDNKDIIEILKYVFTTNKSLSTSDAKRTEMLQLYEENKFCLVDINLLMADNGVENYTPKIQSKVHNGEKVFCLVPFCYVVRNFLPDNEVRILEPIAHVNQSIFNFKLGYVPPKASQEEVIQDIQNHLDLFYNDTIEQSSLRDFLFNKTADNAGIDNSNNRKVNTARVLFAKTICSKFGVDYPTFKTSETVKSSNESISLCLKLVKAVRCLQHKHMSKNNLEKGFNDAVNSSTILGLEFIDDLAAEIMCEVPLSLLNVINTYMFFVAQSARWINEAQTHSISEAYKKQDGVNLRLYGIIGSYNIVCKNLVELEGLKPVPSLKLTPTENLFLTIMRIKNEKLISFGIPLLDNIYNILAKYQAMPNEAYANAYSEYKDTLIAKNALQEEILANWSKYQSFIAEVVTNSDESLLDKKRRDICEYFDRIVIMRNFLYGEEITNDTKLPIMEWLMYLRLFLLFKNHVFNLENLRKHRTEIKILIKLLSSSNDKLQELPLHVELWRHIIFCSFLYINPGMESTVYLELETRYIIELWKKRMIETFNWSNVRIFTFLNIRNATLLSLNWKDN